LIRISLVQLFVKRSRFRAIAAALMGARIELAVSSAILLEYEEGRCRVPGERINDRP